LIGGELGTQQALSPMLEPGNLLVLISWQAIAEQNGAGINRQGQENPLLI
jgi:hypothetical protein